MHQDSSIITFCRTDDVVDAIAVNIEEDCILSRGRLPNGDGLPGGTTRVGARREIDACQSTLLPTGHEIRRPVAVDIRRAHTIRAKRRGVDDVPLPRLRVLRDDGGQVRQAREHPDCHNRI